MLLSNADDGNLATWDIRNLDLNLRYNYIVNWYFIEDSLKKKIYFFFRLLQYFAHAYVNSSEFSGVAYVQ